MTLDEFVKVLLVIAGCVVIPTAIQLAVLEVLDWTRHKGWR